MTFLCRSARNQIYPVLTGTTILPTSTRRANTDKSRCSLYPSKRPTAGTTLTNISSFMGAGFCRGLILLCPRLREVKHPAGVPLAGPLTRLGAMRGSDNMRTLRSNKLSLVQPLLVAGLVIFQGMVSRTFAGKEGESDRK